MLTHGAPAMARNRSISWLGVAAGLFDSFSSVRVPFISGAVPFVSILKYQSAVSLSSASFRRPEACAKIRFMPTPPGFHGRLVKMSDAPKRLRHTTPKAFTAGGDAWREALLMMSEDWIPAGEAYAFVVSQAILAHHGIKDLRAFARPVKAFVKKRYGTKYKVKALNTIEGPTVLICRPK